MGLLVNGWQFHLARACQAPARRSCLKPATLGFRRQAAIPPSLTQGAFLHSATGNAPFFPRTRNSQHTRQSALSFDLHRRAFSSVSRPTDNGKQPIPEPGLDQPSSSPPSSPPQTVTVTSQPDSDQPSQLEAKGRRLTIARVKFLARHGWDNTKRMFKAFATGCKKFSVNAKISWSLLRRKMRGERLSLREHKLLVRTTLDLMKLIPFSILFLIPLGELAIPVLLRCYPNMIPSTFSFKEKDASYKNRKAEARKELAGFFHEVVDERTKQSLERNLRDLNAKTQMLREFQNIVLLLSTFPSLEVTLGFAQLFKDEFKLETMPLDGLKVIARCLGLSPGYLHAQVVIQLRLGCGMRLVNLRKPGPLPPFSSHSPQFQFTLASLCPYCRRHIARILREDKMIKREGVESLHREELVEACKARMMKSHGISDDQMRDQMQQWLELSAHAQIPPLLLLWAGSVTMTRSPVPIEEATRQRARILTDKPIVGGDVDVVKDRMQGNIEDIGDRMHDEDEKEESAPSSGKNLKDFDDSAVDFALKVLQKEAARLNKGEHDHPQSAEARRPQSEGKTTPRVRVEADGDSNLVSRKEYDRLMRIVVLQRSELLSQKQCLEQLAKSDTLNSARSIDEMNDAITKTLSKVEELETHSKT
eukprot:GHVN01096599.1.p1 GENE.GHVN01096599.1~~GHVN01096599.1.p1  ORF type:complete len:647 (+),score=67.73 GHVN01096599.1:1166-3106(+)